MEAELKFVKVLLIALAIVAAASAEVWPVGLKEQIAFARAGTTYDAKQVCSCRFIGARPLTSCTGDFTQNVSVFAFSESGPVIRASVLSGLVRAEAKFEEGIGCALVKP